MEFVEQNGGDAGKLRIVEDHAREDAFGHHLDGDVGARLRCEPCSEADAISKACAERGCKPFGSGARGDPARFEDDDLAAIAPRLIEQRQRHARRLAGAGRRNEDAGSVRAERIAHVTKNGIDRQRRGDYRTGHDGKIG